MNVGSLFSGIGGIDLGLERAGMAIVWQCESDEYRRAVLARHWPDVPCFEDVRDVRFETAQAVDILAGGFPDEVLVRERVIFAELKSESGRLSGEQERWLTALANAGQEVYVWRPHDLDLVEQVSPGPYLELFARRNRFGWDTWGNECFEHVEMDGAA